MGERSACVVAIRPDGAMLAVSRPEPPLRYGFPGGQVEPGEVPRKAAERELYEETGLFAFGRLHKICELRRGKRLVTFFLAEQVFGRLRSSEEGHAAWVDPRILYCPGSAFPETSRVVLRKLGYTLRSCR